MKYPLPTTIVPASAREGLNQKILLLVGSGDMQGITPADVYQVYTGEGGLHGLNRKDFTSYHRFSEAKKEIENGQFFTPGCLCELISKCVPVSSMDLVADLTCGRGDFFNFMPVESNLYGCELDAKAFKIATYLYPEANLIQGDIRYYQTEQKFDLIFGNPPFNLWWKIGKDEIISQLFFLQKCFEVLAPGGIVSLITPKSFLADDFKDVNVISQINEMFSFLGQAKLPANAFSSIGVSHFETKVLFFQKKFDGIDNKPYVVNRFVPFKPDDIRTSLILPALSQKHAIRHQVQLLRSAETGLNNWSFKNNSLRPHSGFEFQLKKLLFEIKSHPITRTSYTKAINILHKYKTQVRPEDMKPEEWEKIRLTENKVLGQFRRILSSGLNPQKKRTGFAVLKNQSGLLIKGFDPASSKQLKEGNIKTLLPFHQLVQNSSLLTTHPYYSILAPFRKLVERKSKAYKNQICQFSAFSRDADLDAQLDSFTFISKDEKPYSLNAIQKEDLGLILQKKFGSILNWQQGGGKTVGAYALHKILGHRYKNTFIVGPPIAVKMTWIPFLKRNHVDFTVLEKLSDMAAIKPGQVVVIAMTKLDRLSRNLKGYLKAIQQKAILIFDESDEITNYSSQRSRNMRNIFRKVRFKLLTTGTTTRNNIAELYGQLELLFNNSYTFICEPTHVYQETRTEEGPKITSELNLAEGLPFPARGGYQLFKSCFSPSKASVFGIGKLNQDIYNTEALERLIGSTIITRKFKDIVGPDRYEIHTTTIEQKPWEVDFYKTILEEFYLILPQFYSSTGNARKDAMLRIIRQLRTLITACSIPNLMSKIDSVPQKTTSILSLIRSKSTRVLLGCTTKRAASFYKLQIEKSFPMRPVFFITGAEGSFIKRQRIIDAFEKSVDGILVCTQQSLSSSVNIPLCNEVIIESLQWNLPRIEQFTFRTIRFDSPRKTNIHYFIYSNSIEVNIMTLLLDKERINDFIKTKEFRGIEEVFGDFKLNTSFLDMLIEKVKDEEGKVHVKWGQQKLVA